MCSFAREPGTSRMHVRVCLAITRSGRSLPARFGSAYDGARHSAQWRFQRSGFDLSADVNLLQTGGSAERTRFSRPKIDAAKTFFRQNKKPLLTAGLHAERERNERRLPGADTLSSASFWYDLGRIFV